MAKAFQVRVRNMSSLQAKVKKANWAIQAGVVVGLRSLAGPIEEDVKESIKTGARTGKTVRRYNPFRIHKASAPGEPPANDMGLLAASISVDVDPHEYNLEISANAAYAKDLELGNRRMLPRPFLLPALNRWRQRIIDAIHQAVRKGLSNV